MVDIASLGFGVDSTPLVRSHEALDMLAQRARAAEQSVQGFGQQVSLANSGFITFTNGLGTATTHLSQMAASLQTVVGHLQLYRREIDLSASSFELFGKARDRVEALATSLGTSAIALESFSRQSAVVGMTSLETASAVQRVTAAIEGQTAAGRQLREVMQDYGVVLTGMSASNADQVLARFIDQARQYRATPGNTRVVNEVLGPLSVEATTSILNPDYEPVAQRRARMQASDLSQRNAEMLDTATQVIRDTRRSVNELSDLRRHYDVSRLSPNQLGTVFQGMDAPPLSMQDPRNELEVLRYVDRFGSAEQKAGARRPYGPGRLLHGEFSMGRLLPDAPKWHGVWDAMTAVGGVGDGPFEMDTNPMMLGWNLISGFMNNRVARPGIAANLANVQAQALQQSAGPGGWLGSGYLSGTGGASAIDIFRNSAAGSLLFGGASALFGGNPTVPLSSDSRALSARELSQQRTADAQRLSELGVGEPARRESAETLLRALSRGEGRDRPSDALIALRNAFIQPTGVGGAVMQGDINDALLEANPRFENLYDLAQVGRDDAMQPGAARMRQLDMDKWLRSVPMAQRGDARRLMAFAQSNGVSTRQWSQRGLSPNALASGLVTGAGALSPMQASAFGRIRTAENEAYAEDSGDELLHEVSMQMKIRDAIAEGGAAVEEATAKWQAYYSALRAGRNDAQATVDAERAVTETVMRRTTAIAKEADAMDRNAVNTFTTDLMVKDAGYNPVARAAARIEGGLQADFTQRASRGLPGAWSEYGVRRRQDIAGEGMRGADDIRAQTETLVDQQRRVTAAAGARADVQARIASDLQVEAQFTERLAQAQTDLTGNATRKVLEHMAAVKQLRAEYDQLKVAAENIKFGADAEWQAGVTAETARMTPDERRLFQRMRPVLDQNRISPTEFLPGAARERGRQYDPYFGQASAFTGGRLPPEVFAAMAYRESSMLADPPNAGGVPGVRGIMQFDEPTGRENGLTIGGGVDDRLDPTRAIPAAGRMLGKEMNRLGINGRVTDMATMYRLLERYGMVKRGEKLPAHVEALFEMALQGQSVDARTNVTNLMGGAFPGGEAVVAGARAGIATDRLTANTEADEEFAVQQARSRAILRLTAAGGGDFGRQLSSAIVVDPRSPIGGDDARRRVQGVISSRQEGIASQTAGLEETARGANELAEAYRRSREEGEAFERHMGNNALVSALRNTAKEFPQVAKEIEGMAVQLERLNPLIDRAAANQAGARFRQGVRRDERQGEFYQADIDAGWWASSSRRGEERARVQARQIAEDTRLSDNPISEDAAYKARAAIERQRELGEETRNTRQEFDRLKISAMSAFEGAVLGGKDLSGILQALGQDLARFAMRIGPERLLMKGLESGVDWIGGKISDAGVSGLMSAINPFSWFGADGLVVSNGVPHRYAASGMMVNRPTTFMAQGGTVTAGEVNDEAIFPLKRDASGNLGIRASGGGPSIVVNAPITVEGGAAKGGQGGGMEPAAMAQMQRDLERTINQAVRNSIANERRDGGDLYL